MELFSEYAEERKGAGQVFPCPFVVSFAPQEKGAVDDQAVW